jgi:hypothetical protein
MPHIPLSYLINLQTSPIDPHVQKLRATAGHSGGRISDRMQKEKAWRTGAVWRLKQICHGDMAPICTDSEEQIDNFFPVAYHS